MNRCKRLNGLGLQSQVLLSKVLKRHCQHFLVVKEKMLSGLKFVSRDEIETVISDNFNDSRKDKKKSRHRKGDDGRKKKSSRYSSSDDEDLERIKKRSPQQNKWYASDEDLSSSESRSDSGTDPKERKNRSRSKKRKDRRHEDSTSHEGKGRSKKSSRSGKKNYLSEEYSSSDSESESFDGYSGKEDKHFKKGDDDGLHPSSKNDVARKESGLEWMVRPEDKILRKSADNPPESEEPPVEEIMKENPKELNRYLKNNGSGYPEDSDEKVGGNQLLSSHIVGDGGASWRLKALKRAKEQATREGRNLEEVVGERWGSLSQMAVSVASHAAAPSHAHLRAIKSRKRGLPEGHQAVTEKHNERDHKHDTEKDVSRRHLQMRMPKVRDSLTWRKQQRENASIETAGVLSSAMSSVNKFANDGSFYREFMHQKNDGSSASSYAKHETEVKLESSSLELEKPKNDGATVKPTLSANQVAAKALQLRLKGKHEEANKLLKEAENGKKDESSKVLDEGSSRSYIFHDISRQQKKNEDDADMHLAQKISRNKQYSISGRADDEYDYDDDPKRKARKTGGGSDLKASKASHVVNRILTQQERCQFCFENPTRRKHVVLAVANFTYLSLPHWQPIVPGHCIILPMQHESSTRTVDNNVWDEIRNFKKCLIMMFAKQEKDPVFLETVMGLSQQRRHCLVECIPLPRDVAKQAPLYFKKAIDEAEDEWSQHNAKKLIDTSRKGLKGSIPPNFPYFHVEFGLDKGFVHVIDDEKQFKSNFGLNVLRGMLHLAAEDMHGHRKRESADAQKQAVSNFARDWDPFDWTKQLE